MIYPKYYPFSIRSAMSRRTCNTMPVSRPLYATVHNQPPDQVRTRVAYATNNVRLVTTHQSNMVAPVMKQPLQKKWSLATKLIAATEMLPLMTPHQRRHFQVAANDGSLAATYRSPLIVDAKYQNSRKQQQSKQRRP